MPFCYLKRFDKCIFKKLPVCCGQFNSNSHPLNRANSTIENLAQPLWLETKWQIANGNFIIHKLLNINVAVICAGDSY